MPTGCQIEDGVSVDPETFPPYAEFGVVTCDENLLRLGERIRLGEGQYSPSLISNPPPPEICVDGQLPLNLGWCVFYCEFDRESDDLSRFCGAVSYNKKTRVCRLYFDADYQGNTLLDPAYRIDDPDWVTIRDCDCTGFECNVHPTYPTDPKEFIAPIGFQFFG